MYVCMYVCLFFSLTLAARKGRTGLIENGYPKRWGPGAHMGPGREGKGGINIFSGAELPTKRSLRKSLRVAVGFALNPKWGGVYGRGKGAGEDWLLGGGVWSGIG